MPCLAHLRTRRKHLFDLQFTNTIASLTRIWAMKNETGCHCVAWHLASVPTVLSFCDSSPDGFGLFGVLFVESLTNKSVAGPPSDKAETSFRLHIYKFNCFTHHDMGYEERNRLPLRCLAFSNLCDSIFLLRIIS